MHSHTAPILLVTDLRELVNVCCSNCLCPRLCVLLLVAVEPFVFITESQMCGVMSQASWVPKTKRLSWSTCLFQKQSLLWKVTVWPLFEVCFTPAGGNSVISELCFKELKPSLTWKHISTFAIRLIFFFLDIVLHCPKKRYFIIQRWASARVLCTSVTDTPMSQLAEMRVN